MDSRGIRIRLAEHSSTLCNNGSTLKRNGETKQKATHEDEWDSGGHLAMIMTRTVGRMLMESTQVIEVVDKAQPGFYVCVNSYQSAAINRIQILAAEHLPVDD